MFFDKQKELLREILQEVRGMCDSIKEVTAMSSDVHNANLRIDAIFTRLDNNAILTDKIEAQAAEIKELKARLAEAEQENLRVVNEDLRKANESLREAVGTILAQKEKDDDLLGDLKAYLKTQGHNMDELTACFDAVLGGMFDHDFIEFVALKTYRGWKYIYCDGEVYGNFDDIDKITMTTTDDGKHVDLTISRKDAKQC